MFVFVVIAVIVLIVGFFKNIFTKPYKAGSIKNVNQFRRDVQNPNVSPKQLDKFIKEGKYRK